MNNYVMKIEGVDAVWSHLKAKTGVECIKNFFGENPSILRKDGLHLTLERHPAGVKIKYAVSGRPPNLKIEIYTRPGNGK
jgi:hypothetical protein